MPWRFELPETQFFVPQIRNVDPLWKESTDDRCIPHTNGQQHGTRFYVMASSYGCHHCSITTMTYPFSQLGVEFFERICEVTHTAPGFTAEIVDITFNGWHATFDAMPHHVGLLKFKTLFWKGHQQPCFSL